VARLPFQDETVTAAYFRSITDADAEAQLRHPTLWSYIARDPGGVIYSHGRLGTRKACERSAIRDAEEYAKYIGSKVKDKPWLLDGWRFLIWPPSAKPGQVLRLSGMQIDVLLLGVDHKFARSCLGWWSDDDLSFFRPATIKSLHKRGLLDANFNDVRVLDGDTRGVENLDGARHEHSPEVAKFQVWTSALGMKVLQDKGLLPNDSELRYH
jgi:hypothetical protein